MYAFVFPLCKDVSIRWTNVTQHCFRYSQPEIGFILCWVNLQRVFLFSFWKNDYLMKAIFYSKKNKTENTHICWGDEGVGLGVNKTCGVFHHEKSLISKETSSGLASSLLFVFFCPTAEDSHWDALAFVRGGDDCSLQECRLPYNTPVMWHLVHFFVPFLKLILLLEVPNAAHHCLLCRYGLRRGVLLKDT